MRDQLGAVAAIAVDKSDNVAILGGVSSRPAGAAVAALAQADNAGARGSRILDGAIGAAAINDDDVVDNRSRHGGNHAPNRFLFVEGRDDERNKRPCHCSEAPAQPATGTSGRRLVAQ